MAIYAAYRESRPLLLITGSITLCLFVFAMIVIRDRLSTIFPFLYILSSVGMSFAMAGMIKSRDELFRLATDSAEHSFAEQVPQVVSHRSSEVSAISDSPPDYDSCLPPKYEDAVRSQCVWHHECKWCQLMSSDANCYLWPMSLSLSFIIVKYLIIYHHWIIRAWSSYLWSEFVIF